MITAVGYLGQAVAIGVSGNYALNPRYSRTYKIETLSGSLILPDATLLEPGGPHLFVVNASGATKTVKYRDGTTYVTLPNGQATKFFLINNSTTNGTWHYKASVSRVFHRIARSDFPGAETFAPPTIDCTPTCYKLTQVGSISTVFYTQDDLSLYVGSVILATAQAYLVTPPYPVVKSQYYTVELSDAAHCIAGPLKSVTVQNFISDAPSWDFKIDGSVSTAGMTFNTIVGHDNAGSRHVFTFTALGTTPVGFVKYYSAPNSTVFSSCISGNVLTGATLMLKMIANIKRGWGGAPFPRPAPNTGTLPTRYVLCILSIS